jgi:hypothetical protein
MQGRHPRDQAMTTKALRNGSQSSAKAMARIDRRPSEQACSACKPLAGRLQTARRTRQISNDLQAPDGSAVQNYRRFRVNACRSLLIHAP